MMTAARCPLVEEIRPLCGEEELFLRLAGRRHCLFLDSAMKGPTLGRYSFLAADPFEYLEFTADQAAQGADGLGLLAQKMAAYRADAVPGLPPFQGGAAGLLSYDLGRQLETLPRPRIDEFRAPLLAVGFYDVVIALDHSEGRGWIISQGFPAIEPAARLDRAASRLKEVRSWLSGPVPDSPRSSSRSTLPPVTADELSPQHAAGGIEGLSSNFPRQGYLHAVRRAIDYVYAGDVFQVNLAQRLLYPACDDSAGLYLRLRRRNPAPFAGYFDLGGFQIASASPERFFTVRDGSVEARPIKGTRPRTLKPEADRSAAEALQSSEKDRAENVMIVDLLRNDLSKVCRPESVCVSRLCGLEVYAYVQHLVSVIRGRLRDECGAVDLVKAAFPGGSVTGAPKIRAMEIIAELEPTARGPYCGSLGYLGFDGTMDLSILIRTITAGRGWWQFPVGGGIVAQSDPQQEYQETWDKAEGLLRALQP